MNKMIVVACKNKQDYVIEKAKNGCLFKWFADVTGMARPNQGRGWTKEHSPVAFVPTP